MKSNMVTFLELSPISIQASKHVCLYVKTITLRLC